MTNIRRNWLNASLLGTCASLSPLTHADTFNGLNNIQHIVVIYAENRSFDNLYGEFPHANGVNNASKESQLQLDSNGETLPFLPPVWLNRNEADAHFPAKLDNHAFQINALGEGHQLTDKTRDLIHRFYQNQEQINGGKNNRFAAISDAGGLTMGYYDGSALPMWKIAQTYTLADNFFMGAFGGSFLNHLYLVCACAPTYADAPENMRVKLDAQGHLLRTANSPTSALSGPPQYVADNAITPDGYAINTMSPPYQPSGIAPESLNSAAYANAHLYPLPPQTMRTIGDALNEKGVSWKWYAGGWNAALADGMQAPDVKRKVIYSKEDGTLKFQAHHQPFNYFQNLAPGTQQRAEHLRDGSDFLQDIQTGNLPAVSFYKPAGENNEHPGYADILSGDQHIADLIATLQASPQWKNTAIIVTYDENGGFWDHVAPPQGDRWGPGTRIPTIIVSPYAKKGFVDHTQYDTSSILKFITKRFDLKPIAGVRPNVGDLTNALDFENVQPNP
jgi:acid phosphatase